MPESSHEKIIDTGATPVQNRQIMTYFTILFLAVYIASGITGLPVNLYLEHVLKVRAETTAQFNFYLSFPAFFGFAFGIIRDRWNPFKLGEVGYFFLFAPIAFLAYMGLSGVKPTIATLFLGIIVSLIAFRFLLGAAMGLMSKVGKRYAMTGRLAAMWNTVMTIPTILSFLIGGWLSQNIPLAWTFRIAALLYLFVGVVALWRPKVIFFRPAPKGEADEGVPEKKEIAPISHQVMTLLRCRGFWVAIWIWFLWSFAPGFQTPLQYYLTKTVHLTDFQFGLWGAVNGAGFIPFFILFAYLARKVQIKKLLFWGTIIGIPQMIPLLFLHGLYQALACAALIGFMGGIASAAYYDLIIKSCPHGLEGTGMLIGDAAMVLAARGGDLFGSWMYDKKGFLICVIVTVSLYVLILPSLLFIPKHLTEIHDDQKVIEAA